MITWVIAMCFVSSFVLTDAYGTFHPVKIKIEYSADIKNNSTLLLTLQDVLSAAAIRVGNLLAVRDSNGTLLLRRINGCKHVWRSGPNKNKCSQIKSHSDEYCSSNGAKFEIPSEHLERLDIYDFSNTLPLENSVMAGIGIQNADVIVYLHMTHGAMCVSKGTVAHASYCREDETKRPIAGYINICPISWRFIHSRDIWMNVMIHELFHVLGFSIKTFSHLRRLYGKNFIVTDKQSITRLRLPSLIREMHNHYNCSLEDFGGPLSSQVTEVNGGLHWHPKLLSQSIMIPEVYKQNDLLIDKFTLALFEATQWYKVNYTAADSYSLGQGMGCKYNGTELASTIPNSTVFTSTFNTPLSHVLEESISTSTNSILLPHVDVFVEPKLDAISKAIMVSFQYWIYLKSLILVVLITCI